MLNIEKLREMREQVYGQYHLFEKHFSLLDRIFFIELISFISKLNCLIIFCKVGSILLMLAYQHLHRRIYLTLPFVTICCIYQVVFFSFFFSRTEGMCSLNQFFSSQWSRSHAYVKLPGSMFLRCLLLLFFGCNMREICSVALN